MSEMSEREFLFIIEEEQQGLRLDLLLSELMEDVSRSYIQKLFESERILLNEEVLKSKKHLPKSGDRVKVILPPEESSVPQGEDIHLPIVYEDEEVMVIDKPKGLVVHPAAGTKTGTLVNGLINYLGEGFRKSMEGVCDASRPGIVHRIDKDTTGLIVVAKTTESFENLSRQFRNHTITRKYTALVYNNFTEDEGTIDLPIGRGRKNRLKREVNGLEPRDAITHYKVIKRFGKYTLIEAQLETGRTHQIRVHMAYVGHPLVGDPVYGPRSNPLKADGQMLHAGILGFHNSEGTYKEFRSSPPESFLKVLRKVEK